MQPLQSAYTCRCIALVLHPSSQPACQLVSCYFTMRTAMPCPPMRLMIKSSKHKLACPCHVRARRKSSFLRHRHSLHKKHLTGRDDPLLAGVQAQLDILGQDHVGYSSKSFPEQGISVVGGRPFSAVSNSSWNTLLAP